MVMGLSLNPPARHLCGPLSSTGGCATSYQLAFWCPTVNAYGVWVGVAAAVCAAAAAAACAAICAPQAAAPAGVITP